MRLDAYVIVARFKVNGMRLMCSDEVIDDARYMVQYARPVLSNMFAR